MTKAEKADSMKRFTEKETNILLSVSALNQGLNIPDIDAAMCISYDSTPLTFQQQVGRVSRLNGSKIATFVNLFFSGTQEEVWLRKKLGDSANQHKWLDVTALSQIT